MIGGGPAGIFAALTYSSIKSGGNVLLIEKNPVLGSKLLSTGGGRCNLTNESMSESFYHGENPKFIMNILSRFSADDLTEYFERRGVQFVSEKGRIYTKSGRASDVLDALEKEMAGSRIEIMVSSRVESISENDGGFKIEINGGRTAAAKKLLVASGGSSYPQLGSTDDAVLFARQMGIEASEMRPALTGINTGDSLLRGMRGVQFRAALTVSRDGKKMHKTEGDCLTTEHGLSGPAVMNLTNEINGSSSEGYLVTVDFIRRGSSDEEAGIFNEFCEKNRNLSVKRYFERFAPSRLAAGIVKEVLNGKEEKCGMVSKDDRRRLTEAFCSYDAKYTSLRGMREAQAVKGGVSTREIDPRRMMSKKHKNLFFAGDALNIWGDCGGYNLQLAFSGGFVAGEEAAVEI